MQDQPRALIRSFLQANGAEADEHMQEYLTAALSNEEDASTLAEVDDIMCSISAAFACKSESDRADILAEIFSNVSAMHADAV